MRSNYRPLPILALLLAVPLLGAAAPAAALTCVPFLTYVDLGTGGFIHNPGLGLTVLQMDPIANTIFNPDCDVNQWWAALIEVKIPPQCSCAVVWVEYKGEPQGWTVNIGDSPTDNGFGGDSGSLPPGQNAEVDVLHHRLTVWSAADNPLDVEPLLTQHLALEDGSLKFLVCDQSVSVGQPFAKVDTPDLERLFFLPTNPVAPDNRTIYVGINRVVAPIGGPNGLRNGCGARRALAIFQ